MISLKNKVAIVTGASTPKGIGKATALKLAKEGAKVVVTDITKNGDRTAITAVVNAIQERGGTAMGIEVDVTNTQQIQACIQQTLAEFGRIDILFNNAGTPVGVGPFLELSERQFQLSLDINLMGMVRFCQSLIPVMQEQGGGSIINNSSLIGLGGWSEYAAYAVSKWGVVGLTKSLATEFGKDNIRVNAVCPGMVATEMSDIEINGYAKEKGLSFATAKKELGETYVPLGRYAEPEEVADAVAYLASDAAKYITGVALPVAGGLAPGL